MNWILEGRGSSAPAHGDATVLGEAAPVIRCTAGTEAVLDPPPTPALETVAAALNTAAAGARLDIPQVEALLHARGDHFERMLWLAGLARDAGLHAAGRSGILTYSRKVFVPLTTLCRDRCHYCIFVDTPGQLVKKRQPAYMSPEQVLAVVRQGAAMGCKEALLTLGDRPEHRWPEARAWLDEHGYASTVEYVGHIARLITAETGMLAHLNPGVLTANELRMLRPTAASMGMMLETTSERLFTQPGQVHYGSPDKNPALRLAVIEDAGRERVPFTTGILVGIGETVRDRAESLVALRDSAERHGHVQEIIVQNFRAKQRTAMHGVPDAELVEYVAAVAVARLVFGPGMRIQVPPNLSDPQAFELLVRAGADDWGGVSPLTADHVNPERPWPHLDDLSARTAELGFILRERLTVHPEFVNKPSFWIDPALHAPVAALAAADGLAADVAPTPHVSAGSRFPLVWDGRRAVGSAVRHLAQMAAADPLTLDDAEWEKLLSATGADLDVLASTADDVRRYTVGEAVSLVVNRNLTSTGLGVSYALDDVTAIATDAWDLGVTEICVQGRLDESVDPVGYLDVARAIKAATGRVHLHAYRPQDIADLADRGGLGVAGALTALRAAGVDTVPGTGVKVLSERVRGIIAPDDLEIDRWIENITAAHRAGFRSTSVLFYGHVESAAERVAHLRALRTLQSSTGGFTEFVPIPLPGPAGGVPIVAGRMPIDEHRAMVAVSRLLLSGSIPHVQIPWTRVGREAAAVLLQSGGDDLGGALLDGRVKPDAGVEHGQELPVADAAALAGRLFRPFRQRTTDYREPPADRKAGLR
ncbi:7,8-didemethyl-8-hydroxy-5-deazariboflavin synthase CofG [Microbacterium trichothecenolyticum]|uniref:7,8-didemethyl-8-hydroxy-5-deazariboflavin synthase n=1 Tax=Microbacterium ureisolvens TaxID=2781186 RepID=A0ABS7HYU9_9MICO|nr:MULTISPECIES: 7,8-didemethyl-8-hydroxy-5-deazariboflavin synthase CofG [Microbacterium]MBW9110438.1 7,8-didemethyl-8-hydroxy-5-deazariboflavin synthase CofG [Microbacterium ureisolvens]MBW9120543.1 7,8-didemethyl-8-hydroxy-5-deazariboflavin synthase CofG [Microbacterium trichothecenolyticum]